MSQKGYLIVEAKVSDVAAYEIYKGLAKLAIAQYGGRYLVRGGAVEILEGKWTNTAATGHCRVRIRGTGEVFLSFS